MSMPKTWRDYQSELQRGKEAAVVGLWWFILGALIFAVVGYWAGGR